MRLVARVRSRVVEPQHDVPLDAVRVVDEQIGNGRAVCNELRADPLGLERVLAVRVDRNRRLGRQRGVLHQPARHGPRERRREEQDSALHRRRVETRPLLSQKSVWRLLFHDLKPDNTV
jgi:hypothetical protein